MGQIRPPSHRLAVLELCAKIVPCLFEIFHSCLWWTVEMHTPWPPPQPRCRSFCEEGPAAQLQAVWTADIPGWGGGCSPGWPQQQEPPRQATPLPLPGDSQQQGAVERGSATSAQSASPLGPAFEGPASRFNVQLCPILPLPSYAFLGEIFF